MTDTKSDTPRTDAVAKVSGYSWGNDVSIYSNLCMELERENEALRKDAERYRYLKKHLHEPHAIQHFVAFNNWHPSDAEKLKDLDSAIDAAIKEQSNGY